MAPVTERLQVVLVPLCPAIQSGNDVVHDRASGDNAMFLAFSAQWFPFSVADGQSSPASQIIKGIMPSLLRLLVLVEWLENWHSVENSTTVNDLHRFFVRHGLPRKISLDRDFFAVE